MDEESAEIVANALKFAEESPQPEPDELYRDVVAE
jgi:TPP-dependent pyruvate/acetoin dehydrogenase alpha subunit